MRNLRAMSKDHLKKTFKVHAMIRHPVSTHTIKEEGRSIPHTPEVVALQLNSTS